MRAYRIRGHASSLQAAIKAVSLCKLSRNRAFTTPGKWFNVDKQHLLTIKGSPTYG
jgi:hypothetical protein